MNRTKTKNKNIWALSVTAAFMLLALIVMAQSVAHAASKPVKITVSQIFSASSAPAGDVFTYILKPIGTGVPMPAYSGTRGYAFSIAGNGSVEIGPLTYGSQGVYRYEIFQEIDSYKSGYSYDRRTFAVEVHVDEELRAAVVAFVDIDRKVNNIAFENGYKAMASDPKLMVDPPVRKTVTGEPDRDSVFIFKLIAQNPSNPMPSGSANGIKTMSITGSGFAEFGVWSYDKAGVYHYTVYEENTGEKGYTYDAAVYSIADIVTEENGRLVLSRAVTNELNKRVSTLDFENKYSTLNRVLGTGPIRNDDPNRDSDITDDGNPGGGLNLNNIPDDGSPGGGAPGGGAQGGSPGGGSAGSGGKTGVNGPKTGDDMNAALYIALLILGGALSAGTAICLAAAGKKGKRGGEPRGLKQYNAVKTRERGGAGI